MASVVSDLVTSTVGAACEAIAFHYWHIFRPLKKAEPSAARFVTNALDHGYDADFDELISPRQITGFDHSAISKIFRRHLSDSFPHRNHLKNHSHHIWGADEDHAIYSLFGREPSPNDASPLRRRTRASAIVQVALRHCRTMRHAEKATTGLPSELVTVPSPLHIARQLLSDPKNAASQVCVVAALQELVRERVENAFGTPIDLSFSALTEALTTINNRWKTSKPIKANLSQNGPTVLFLCNLFAMLGLMAIRLEPTQIESMAHPLSDAWLRDSPENKKLRERADLVTSRFWDLLNGIGNADVEFLVDPQFTRLPDAGRILNMIEGLPLPLEGALAVFQGGLRLSEGQSSVIAISGQFGAGKTLLGLSLAAALAPLGCKTLFLSCEERREDLQARLAEAAPSGLVDSAALFGALDQQDFLLSQFLPDSNKDGSTSDLKASWFRAREVKLEYENAGSQITSESRLVIDPAAALSDMLKDAILNAEFFRTLRNSKKPLPRFARPIVIIDGLHQLFDFARTTNIHVDASLRNLVDQCRDLGAVFIFSFSSDANELKQLEYLCDLIIELDRGGYDSPTERPKRIFRLLKARRQPARTGAHLFHIKSNEGFRLKPSLDSRVYESKSQRWWEPDDREEVFLTDDLPTGFSAETEMYSNNLPIRNHSQILVLGQGSAGKAGFGLYLLHRRWYDREMFPVESQPGLWPGGDSDGEALESNPISKRKSVIAKSALPVRHAAGYLETRVLVISFLYQETYYNDLTNRLGRRRRRVVRDQAYGPLHGLMKFPYTPMSDRLRTDTIELYPGQLGVEEFLSKVERRLNAAELSGTPYTGVLIDGLHNVFVQYPALEDESEFWGIFYNLLRRRRVTVVTTHTEFDLQSLPQFAARGGDRSWHKPSLIYDFEQAQRKIAPLLAAMVSGADYVFNLSPSEDKGKALLVPMNGWDFEFADREYLWLRSRLRLVRITPRQSVS